MGTAVSTRSARDPASASTPPSVPHNDALDKRQTRVCLGPPEPRCRSPLAIGDGDRRPALHPAGARRHRAAVGVEVRVSDTGPDWAIHPWAQRSLRHTSPGVSSGSLVASSVDDWHRPLDLCVAPDLGSPSCTSWIRGRHRCVEPDWRSSAGRRARSERSWPPRGHFSPRRVSESTRACDVAPSPESPCRRGAYAAAVSQSSSIAGGWRRSDSRAAETRCIDQLERDASTRRPSRSSEATGSLDRCGGGLLGGLSGATTPRRLVQPPWCR